MHEQILLVYDLELLTKECSAINCSSVEKGVGIIAVSINE